MIIKWTSIHFKPTEQIYLYFNRATRIPSVLVILNRVALTDGRKIFVIFVIICLLRRLQVVWCAEKNREEQCG